MTDQHPTARQQYFAERAHAVAALETVRADIGRAEDEAVRLAAAQWRRDCHLEAGVNTPTEDAQSARLVQLRTDLRRLRKRRRQLSADLHILNILAN